MLTALLMLLYLPAGYGVSRLRQWPLPDGRTGVKAVLYPAFCAWMYAAIGSVLLCGGTFLAAYEEEHGLEAELPEILAMSDHVVVMRGGRVMANIDRDTPHFNSEDIMKAAWGGELD